MRYSKFISVISALGDLFILNGLYVFSFCYYRSFDASCLHSTALFFYLYINFAWLTSAGIFKLYRLGRNTGKKLIFYSYLKSTIFFFPLFLLFFQVFSFNYLPRPLIKYQFPVFFLVLVMWRILLYYAFFFYRKAGYNYRNVIIIGNNETANELKNFFLHNPWSGYRFKGFFTFEPSNKKEVVGTYEQIESFVTENDINEIYLISNNIEESIFKIITQIVGKYAVKIRIVPYVSNFSFMSVKLENYDALPVLKIQPGPLSFWYNRMVKRLFDILFSIMIVLLVLSWLIPLVWLLNSISGDMGNVFFVQKRTGTDNKTFKMIKFRTMKKNREAHLKQAVKNDDRVTTTGKILRKTSIDEIPQFLNVLTGDMSVVGPRPHMLAHTREYKELVKKFMIRHAVKPGITGYAQARGKRGEIKKIHDLRERIKCDLYYIKNWSLELDAKIILRTIINQISGDKAAY